MSTFISRYMDNLKRSFVTGQGVSPYQSMVSYSAGSDDSWSPSKYGDYIATSSDIYIAANYRAKTLSSVPLRLYKGVGPNRKEVESGTLYEILQKVNPYWTARRLLQMSELSLCLWGSAFWFMERGVNGRGEPREIWWARPDKVKVIPHPTDYISHFEYDNGTGNPIVFRREETVWLRYPNPVDEYSGLSPLAAARVAADTSTNAMRSNSMMFNNGLQLAGFVSPKAGEQWTQEQAEQIEDSLKRRFQGANKAHRWAVLKRETQFQPLSISAKDAEYLGALEWSFETVCRVYGLSPDLLGGKTTFSNSAEARLALWEDTMKPECGFFADELTEQLLPLFPGQADVAEFDLSDVSALKEDADARHARAREDFHAGLLTYDMAREKIGEDPLPNGAGNVIGVPFNILWIDPLKLVEQTAASVYVRPETEIAVQANADPNDPKNVTVPSTDAKPADTKPADPSTDPNAPRRLTRAMEFGGADHQRLWDARVAKVDPFERAFGNMTGRLMRDQQKSIKAKLNAKREAMPDYQDIIDEPFDKPRWVKRFREESRPLIREMVKDAGETVYADIALKGAFDVFEPNVARFIEQRAQRFAVQVNETTWDALRSSLSEGLQAGESIPDLASRVDAVMGERIRSSATTIARTETNGATNGGAIIAAQDSGVVQGKTWVAALDERTRDTHLEAHDQTVPLDGDFTVGGGVGPSPGQIGLAEEDINCRCFLNFVLDTQEMPN